MTNNPRFGNNQPFLQAYRQAQSLHGDLSLDYDSYVDYLFPIITKYLGDQPQDLLVLKFVSELHTDDLYLTLACARRSKAAWERLQRLFGDYAFCLAKRGST